MSIAILKLGGSLLDLPDLSVRLQSVFANLDGDRPLLICGGGEAADIVRRWHDCFELGEERSHWLALEAIRLNQRCSTCCRLWNWSRTAQPPNPFGGAIASRCSI